MEAVRVLVVIPTHDRVQFLDDALDSLRNQTRQPDEIVVTGNVAVKPLTLSHWPALRCSISEEGMCARLNQAIAESMCDAFVLLCDDDKIEPTFLERTVAEMERAEADIVYTDLKRFGTSDRIIRAPEWTSANIEHSTVPFVTSLCTKGMWAKVGGYEDVPFFDWEFWWKCFHAGASAEHLREPLFLYRDHPGQASYREDLAANRRITLQRHREMLAARA